jgi:single-strand DNA-binding protein
MNGIETAFIGRVGKEPELKTSAAGKAWTSFTACVGDGDEAQWVRIAVFGECAEHLAGHLLKGDRVYVEGRLKVDTWTAQNGQQRTGLSVAAWKADKLGQIGRNKPTKPKAPPEGEHPATPTSNRDRQNQQAAAARDYQRPPGDVEIPF